ncbi:MAG TPA: carboxypeptidase regulatory-like domain-containing protein [Longimicrobiales bacterium]
MRFRLYAGLAALGLAACGGGGGPTQPGGGATGSVSGAVTENTAGGVVGVVGASVALTGNGQAARNATSGADGSYTFNSVATGNYTVAVTPPAGFAPGGPATRSIAVTANQQTSVASFVLLRTGGGNVPQLVNVSMTNTSFQPQQVEVAVGGTVRFTNNDPFAHNATGPGVSTGNMTPGQVVEEIMPTAGTFNYTCTLHAGMSGSIVVR